MPARGEDVFVMPDGAIFTGLDDGRLVRVHPGGKVDEIVRTGGRPMGFDLAPDGRLLVCDAFRGLLAVDVATGTIEILVDEVDGRPMKFCNSVTAAPDGALYFTDSSRRFGLDNWRADIFEHSGTGRLLRREPDGTVETVLDGLQFANGVTLDGSRTRVVVAETGAYRLTALHISGPRTGETEILHDNLPGSPDNLARGPGGLIWVALPNPRDPRLDLLHRTPPLLRKVAWALPEQLSPPLRTLWVIAVDDSGAIVRDLQTRERAFHFVTGVAEHDGTLYAVGIREPAMAVITARPPRGRDAA